MVFIVEEMKEELLEYDSFGPFQMSTLGMDEAYQRGTSTTKKT